MAEPTEVDVNVILARYQMRIAELTHAQIMAEARADTAERALAQLRAEQSEEKEE